MTNDVLLAIFYFHGRDAGTFAHCEELLARLFGVLPGGLGLSVVIVGLLLSAAKGVVGATIVTMA
jgi:TRAP-type mannitol/chloroaromatic compound transport system permease large subunit